MFEAAYNGMPVVTIGWSGQLDFLNYKGKNSYCPAASICMPCSASVIAGFICFRFSITTFLNDRSACLLNLATLSSVSLNLLSVVSAGLLLNNINRILN